MTLPLLRLFLIALIVSCFATASRAQTEGQTPAILPAGPLAGVEVMQMSMAPLGPESQRCGLQTNLINESFQQPLTANGIVLQKAAHFRVIIKTTTGIYQSDTCITNIEATVVQTTSYFDRRTQQDRAGQVLLWSQSRLFVSGQPDHVVVVNIGTRELARSFVEKWKADR